MHSKNWGKIFCYYSAVDTFLRQKLSVAKPHLRTPLRLRQLHPAAASFYANTTHTRATACSHLPDRHLPAGSWLTTSAGLGAEGWSQWEQGPPAMPTLHLARPVIEGRDVVIACRMMAWHARAMQFLAHVKKFNLRPVWQCGSETHKASKGLVKWKLFT